MVDASLIHSEHTLLEPQIIPRFHVTQFAFANCVSFATACGSLCWREELSVGADRSMVTL